MSDNQQYNPAKMEVIVQSSEVRVVEFLLPPHTPVPEHHHSNTEEICYCLSGELVCNVQGQRQCVLRSGERFRFAPGIDHELINEGDVPCRFVLIHGVGEFNFIPSNRPNR